jgi:hypothetical protein
MRQTKLRGHAYFLEFAGRQSGGPWLWLLLAIPLLAGAVELAAQGLGR